MQVVIDIPAKVYRVYKSKIIGNKNQYDICWETGQYSDQICELCPYKSECSGYENHND